MSQYVLPNSVNYNDQLPSLSPDIQNFTQVLNPINGNKFDTAGQSIIIDFGNRGFLDPRSIYFSYSMSLTVPATVVPSVCRAPVYAPFTRLDLFINSKLVESINDYNVVASLWTDLYMGPNEKASLQNGFGYSNTDGAITKYDSRLLVTNSTNTYQVSAPIICSMLSGADKMIPLFLLGNVRLVWTLDAPANYTTKTATDITTFSITNFQVTYDMIVGQDIENSVMGLDQIKIKTNAYNQSSVSVPIGTNGQQTFVFNQRLASIRNAILSYSSARDSVFINSKFDSPDAASGDGTKTSYYNLNIGGVSFPQGGPLSGVNKSAILMELRKATGNLYDWSKSMSINNIEFTYGETGANTTNATSLTTAQEPAKFYVGFDLNKINSLSNNMLNGTSTQNSPINAIVNFGAATTLAKSLNLTLNYDAILIINTRTKQLDVLQ